MSTATGHGSAGRKVQCRNGAGAGRAGGGLGEYALQAGFAWTNGVLAKFMAEYPDLALAARAPRIDVAEGRQRRSGAIRPAHRRKIDYKGLPYSPRARQFQRGENMSKLIFIAAAALTVVAASARADERVYVLDKWPDDIEQIPCSAWTKTADGGWVLHGAVKLGASVLSDIAVRGDVAAHIVDRTCGPKK